LNRNEAQKVVTMLLAAFPRDLLPEQVEDTSKIYRIMMKDLDFDRTQLAVYRLLATAKRLPKIAELREALLEVGVGGRRSGAEAWGDVLKAVRKHGAWKDPVFDDPLVAAATAAVGWRAICMADEIDPAPRAKFADAYNRLAERARKELQVSRGAGALPVSAPSAMLASGPTSLGDIIATIQIEGEDVG